MSSHETIAASAPAARASCVCLAALRHDAMAATEQDAMAARRVLISDAAAIAAIVIAPAVAPTRKPGIRRRDFTETASHIAGAQSATAVIMKIKFECDGAGAAMLASRKPDGSKPMAWCK